MTREQAIRELKIRFIGEYDRQREAKDMAIKALEQEPRKGHWIKEKSIHGWDGHSYQCSVCGRSIHLDTAVEDLADYPYCHCGADMREVEQEPIFDKPHIKGDYYDGFKNGLRTAEWRNDKIRTEMFEEMLSHSGTGEEVIQAYVDGLKKGLKIIDKYKGESEE